MDVREWKGKKKDVLAVKSCPNLSKWYGQAAFLSSLNDKQKYNSRYIKREEFSMCNVTHFFS
jgi:hypothetical protein